VLGIGAMGSWETAARPFVSNRPDARAVGAALLSSSISSEAPCVRLLREILLRLFLTNSDGAKVEQ